MIALLGLGWRFWRSDPASRPRALRETLERLGGTFLKFGQVLALRPDVLPRPYCLELFRLLDRVPPFRYEEVRSIVRQELGAPPEDVFAAFDVEPLASASFGQVHRARLPDGRWAAVKVQRPGIGSVVARDLTLLGAIAAVLDGLGVTGLQKLRPTVREFARWTKEELDYTVEARHNQALYEASLGHPNQRMPEPFWEYSSRRVLTNELLDGVAVTEVLEAVYRDDGVALEGPRQRGVDLERVCAHLWNNLGEQVYVEGVFHADPHPANLLILDDDVIGYVDFGIVGRISPAMRSKLERMVRASSAGDLESAADTFLEIAAPTARTIPARFRRDYCNEVGKWLEAASDPRAAFAERSFAALLRISLQLARTHSLRSAPEILTYFRAVMTIDSISLQLAPALDSNEQARRFFRRLARRDREQGGSSEVRTPEELIEAVAHLGRFLVGLPARAEAAAEVWRQDRRRAMLREELADERRAAAARRARVVVGGAITVSAALLAAALSRPALPP
ncbi:MAG TPA: AarF/UbiB family protein, partial [Gemmatimonadota bacterium]|nr:AarF/UbiB family protein [Gemmatimonadota bacterium]